jgi:hypothetical protein
LRVEQQLAHVAQIGAAMSQLLRVYYDMALFFTRDD